MHGILSVSDVSISSWFFSEFPGEAHTHPSCAVFSWLRGLRITSGTSHSYGLTTATT